MGSRKRYWESHPRIAERAAYFLPAPEKVEQIVSMLQEMNGGVYKLPEILQEMKENRLQSRYYNESQNLYNQLFSKPKPR